MLLLATRLGLLGRVLERRRRLDRRVLVGRRGVLGGAVLPIRWGFEGRSQMTGWHDLRTTISCNLWTMRDELLYEFVV